MSTTAHNKVLLGTNLRYTSVGPRARRYVLLVKLKRKCTLNLESYRADFEKSSNRSISMPLAGALVWFIVGLISLKLDFKISLYVLLFSTGIIFPLALLISKFRHEALTSSVNPLSKLMGMSIVMVNLLWGIHLPLIFFAPEFIPLTLGIGLGLHWVIYSWVVQHPLGIIHSVLRTILVVAAWYYFPECRIFSVSVAVVIAYSISLIQMLTRKINTQQVA